MLLRGGVIMLERYPLLEDRGKTMMVFTKNGKFYGHIVKDKTEKSPAKFMFETQTFETIELLKAEYPELKEVG
jgi:hypothetical protein